MIAWYWILPRGWNRVGEGRWKYFEGRFADGLDMEVLGEWAVKDDSQVLVIFHLILKINLEVGGHILVL